jgi:GNAT superfamily N-acetyltransferase
VFKEYPYLYEGSLDYEKSYTASYATDEHALLAVAFDDEKIVGISTGIPLNSNALIVKDLKRKFIDAGVDPSTYYYYGEVIILPEYRGQGLTTKLYHIKEVKAQNWGYTAACILTVKRPDNHPLKPAGYRSPDRLWEHLGFRKDPSFEVSYHWETIIDAHGTHKDMENPMEFWRKPYPQPKCYNELCPR